MILVKNLERLHIRSDLLKKKPLKKADGAIKTWHVGGHAMALPFQFGEKNTKSFFSPFFTSLFRRLCEISHGSLWVSRRFECN